MASAAEQMAGSMNLGAFGKATELKNRIWFTLGALVIYRVGSYVPVPGIDAAAMAQAMTEQGGGVLGMFDMFSGGNISRMTVFALTIMPYISASIIVQLMSAAIPTLETLKKEGESGRKTLNQYTRYLTVLIAIFQSYGIAVGLEVFRTKAGLGAVPDPGLFFRLSCVVTLTGGTMFLMWLGEQITARGVGNGTSLVIFAGIVANLPHALVTLLEEGRTGVLSAGFILGLAVVVVLVIAFIVFMERAQRRIVIQYPKRQVGQRMFGGDSTHMPLKVNTAGRHTADLRLLDLADPGHDRRVRQQQPGFHPGLAVDGTGAWPAAIPAAVCRADRVLLVFLHRSRVQPAGDGGEPQEVRRLHPGHPPRREHGGLLRPHPHPADNHRRAYLCVVCLLPEILIANYNVPFYFGGTSLMIIVSVTMDTVTQVQSHLLAHQYEGLIRKSKVKGRGR